MSEKGPTCPLTEGYGGLKAIWGIKNLFLYRFLFLTLTIMTMAALSVRLQQGMKILVIRSFMSGTFNHQHKVHPNIIIICLIDIIIIIF